MELYHAIEEVVGRRKASLTRTTWQSAKANPKEKANAIARRAEKGDDVSEIQKESESARKNGQ